MSSIKDQYGADYYLRGKELGLSNYTNYRWLPDVTMALARSLVGLLEIKTNDSVLDFGCARGFLVHALRLAGIDAYGFDISQWAVENAHPEVRSHLSNDFPRRKFDWVIAKDVLEHIAPVALNVAVRMLFDTAHRGIFVIVPLSRKQSAPYVRPDDEADVTHKIRWPLESWLNLFQHEGKPLGFSVWGSYWTPDIKQASEPWEGSCGFFIARKVQ